MIGILEAKKFKEDATEIKKCTILWTDFTQNHMPTVGGSTLHLKKDTVQTLCYHSSGLGGGRKLYVVDV
jgi:DUF1680 family protein